MLISYYVQWPKRNQRGNPFQRMNHLRRKTRHRLRRLRVWERGRRVGAKWGRGISWVSSGRSRGRAGYLRWGALIRCFWFGWFRQAKSSEWAEWCWVQNIWIHSGVFQLSSIITTYVAVSTGWSEGTKSWLTLILEFKPIKSGYTSTYRQMFVCLLVCSELFARQQCSLDAGNDNARVSWFLSPPY